MEGVVRRVRLSFEDGRILKKSQRTEGLSMSWLLLKPSLQIISDLSSYIYSTFDLQHSCPNGIILSMDGFVLPPFESVSILKDKDVIGVKRRAKLLSEILNNNNETVEKQTVLTSVPLLTNEEFEKESSGYRSEPEEQEEELEQSKDNQSGDGLYEEKSPHRKKISKKRKASKKLGSSKKKKTKKNLVDIQVSEEDLYVHENANNGFHPGESSGIKKKVPKVKKTRERANTPVSVESNDDSSQSLPSPQRSSPIQENDMRQGASPQVPDVSEKKPSRSARRKKAKRQWLREIVKAEKEAVLLSELQLEKMQSPEIGVNKHSVEYQQQNQSCEADNEIAPDIDYVPVVIRPGHIRFEPLEGDAGGEKLEQRHVSTEITQWNGITNKKKGQKWGKENSTLWKNDEPQGFKTECSETMDIEEVKPPNDHIDFDNLAPLTCLPKEGDLIAYRLVELSSTWTPELTPFRVGKTSWYNSASNNIMLTPLPEYPIVIEKLDEEDTFAQPPQNSFYKEDGSLEIDFSSLVDVRMIKESNSGPTKATSDLANIHLISNGATSTATPSENGTHSEKQATAWDEISESLKAKKAELMQGNGCTKEDTGKSRSSIRVMRGSAMGPIIAKLRANNEI